MVETSFTFEYGGNTHSGTYEIRSKMIHVSTPFGKKSTQLGNMPPATLAKMLGRELAQETKD